jgi:hypothetical protein
MNCVHNRGWLSPVLAALQIASAKLGLDTFSAEHAVTCITAHLLFLLYVRTTSKQTLYWLALRLLYFESEILANLANMYTSIKLLRSLSIRLPCTARLRATDREQYLPHARFACIISSMAEDLKVA